MALCILCQVTHEIYDSRLYQPLWHKEFEEEKYGEKFCDTCRTVWPLQVEPRSMPTAVDNRRLGVTECFPAVKFSIRDLELLPVTLTDVSCRQT